MEPWQRSTALQAGLAKRATVMQLKIPGVGSHITGVPDLSRRQGSGKNYGSLRLAPGGWHTSDCG
jgi:hypothetical protein